MKIGPTKRINSHYEVFKYSKELDTDVAAIQFAEAKFAGGVSNTNLCAQRIITRRGGRVYERNRILRDIITRHANAARFQKRLLSTLAPRFRPRERSEREQ